MSQLEVDTITANSIVTTNFESAIKIKTYSTSTAADGSFSVDLTADGYAQIDFVSATAINASGGSITNQYVASVDSYSSVNCSGHCMRPQTISALGGPSMTYSSSGIGIVVLVIGS